MTRWRGTETELFPCRYVLLSVSKHFVNRKLSTSMALVVLQTKAKSAICHKYPDDVQILKKSPVCIQPVYLAHCVLQCKVLEWLHFFLLFIWLHLIVHNYCQEIGICFCGGFFYLMWLDNSQHPSFIFDKTPVNLILSNYQIGVTLLSGKCSSLGKSWKPTFIYYIIVLEHKWMLHNSGGLLLAVLWFTSTFQTREPAKSGLAYYKLNWTVPCCILLWKSVYSTYCTLHLSVVCSRWFLIQLNFVKKLQNWLC